MTTNVNQLSPIEEEPISQVRDLSMVKKFGSLNVDSDNKVKPSPVMITPFINDFADLKLLSSERKVKDDFNVIKSSLMLDLEDADSHEQDQLIKQLEQ